MLTDEVLDKVSERLVDRIERVNTAILKQMGNNIDEIGKLSSTEAHQLVQMLKYGGDYEKIIKELAKASNLNIEDIESIFNEVAKSDYRFAKQFYDYRNIPYVPYEENLALKNQVDAIISITTNKFKEMMNPSVLGFGFVDDITGEKIFKGLQQSYYDLLDEAVISVAQGKETFDQAMSRQIKEMGGSGLKVIYDSTYVDKKGVLKNRTRRLDSAVRMNMKDALRTLHNETQEIIGKQFGADGVEVSVHLHPAPDHELVQGRQFSKTEFNKFQTDNDAVSYDGIKFPRVSEETGRDRRSISQYNCYHTTFDIVLGVSKPRYSDKELQDIMDENEKGFELDGKQYTTYQGTQMQRRLETEIRKQKDIQIMAKAGNKPDVVRESQQKITELTTKYKELSDVSGLPTRMDRMKVSGYHRLKRYDEPKSILDKQTYTIQKEIDPEFKNFRNMKLFVGNNQVGYLEYQNNKGNITVNVIETDKKYRGQGVASRLLKELKEENGDITYKFSAVLSDGDKLLKKRAKIIKKEYGDYYVKLK